MTETVERLKAELSALSQRERAELAHFLIQSLDQEEEPETEEAWAMELARREEEICSGRAIGIPAEQVHAELRKKYS